jgi:dinuclear metal center YbgI/SA1388 family protein
VATVQDLLNILQDIAADSLAETWDNVGLLIGSPDNRVSSILLGLDPTTDLLAQADECRAELIITHHPAIFHPLKSLRTDRPPGNFIYSALQKDINIIACHTNLDAASGGVSDVLVQAMGVVHAKPLVPGKDVDTGCGLGRIGDLEKPVEADHFVTVIRNALSPPWLLEAGPRPDLVSRVAVCGGSCADFAETAMQAGADVFLTAEIKHSVARWAEEAGLWLIDGGHFATENPAIAALRSLLADRIEQTNPGIRVHTARQEPPLKLIN